jgi:hypothetical protein
MEMKRLIVAVVALVAVFALSSASVYAVEGLSAGVLGGLNISSAYGDDAEDAEIKVGGAFGAFANYVINDYVAVQPELLFSMKGAKGEEAGEDVTLSLNYLEIPILAKVSMPMEGKITPSLLIGPAIGILLTADIEDVDVKDTTKSVDIGLAVGAAVGMEELGPGTASVDAVFTLGMMSTDDSDLEKSIKNWVISVMFGYAFPL